MLDTAVLLEICQHWNKPHGHCATINVTIGITVVQHIRGDVGSWSFM